MPCLSLYFYFSFVLNSCIPGVQQLYFFVTFSPFCSTIDWFVAFYQYLLIYFAFFTSLLLFSLSLYWKKLFLFSLFLWHLLKWKKQKQQEKIKGINWKTIVFKFILILFCENCQTDWLTPFMKPCSDPIVIISCFENFSFFSYVYQLLFSFKVSAFFRSQINNRMEKYFITLTIIWYEYVLYSYLVSIWG